MAKKDKTSERDWKAQAEYLAEENRKLSEQNVELIRRNRYSHYLTVEQFVKEYMGALEEYMRAQYRHGPSDLCHPEDLAASAATFSDAWWSMTQHIEHTSRGLAIGKP